MKLEHDIIVLLLCIIGLLVVILITGCNEEEREALERCELVDTFYTNAMTIVGRDDEPVLVQVLDGCEVVDSYYTNAPAGSTGTVTIIKEEK